MYIYPVLSLFYLQSIPTSLPIRFLSPSLVKNQPFGPALTMDPLTQSLKNLKPAEATSLVCKPRRLLCFSRHRCRSGHHGGEVSRRTFSLGDYHGWWQKRVPESKKNSTRLSKWKKWWCGKPLIPWIEWDFARGSSSGFLRILQIFPSTTLW